MIVCPNCGKRIFDDDKCGFCKFVLKEKKHNFDSEVYQFLYDDYVNTKNKADTIRTGIARFQKPMREIKEIVDFIADEIYEKNNYRSREEIQQREPYQSKSMDNWKSKRATIFLSVLTVISGIAVVVTATKTDNRSIMMTSAVAFLVFLTCFGVSLTPKKVRMKNTYYYSFISYFFHDMLYKLIIVAGLLLAPGLVKHMYVIENNPGLLMIWYAAVLLIALYFLGRGFECTTASFMVEHGEIVYKHQKPNHLNNSDLDRHPEFAWTNYIEYKFFKITKVTETLNSFIIYGDIVRTHEAVKPTNIWTTYKTKQYTKVRIGKHFKDNAKLIDHLKEHIK